METDLAGLLTELENGDLSPKKTHELFSELAKSGMAWQLRGSYSRMAQGLMDAGYLDSGGNFLQGPKQ